ncbi:MAG: DUF3109 family protein [Allomuricauda sp.]|nr:MAG: DUF3109 family protein [Allomuricauda sp.]
MFQIEKTLVSEEILENDFVCNLNACKGACCVEGDSGAPLENEEAEILDAIIEQVKPYLRTEGVQAIQHQGTHVRGADGELETPLVNGNECAYTIFSEKGTAKCGIEEAYAQGAILWRKPISCHLYPVRTKKYSEFTAVNYHKWPICDSACSLGKELQVPIYVFVKEALIRKFGQQWYAELEQTASEFTRK